MSLRVVFAGTPDFSVPTLGMLLNHPEIEVVGVVSQPDRPAGRGMKLTASPVKARAVAAGVEVITPERLRGNDEALAWLTQKQPELLVVVAFGMILPKSWLETPRLGAVNVHASLLPRWRGAAPIERALLAGDSETGVGIMRMEEGLDTGPLYAEERLPISRLTNAGDLWDALALFGAMTLRNTLPAILNGATPTPQAEEGVTYAKKLSNSERELNWQLPAVQIDRVVRAFAPAPGARSTFRGKLIKILEGEHEALALAPGLLRADGDALLVGCGEGSYRIHKLQPEGKQAMGAADFLRGQPLQAGERFGE